MASLAGLLGAASLVMASTTCVTAAIPDIGRELSASQAEIQWVADAYPVVLAALLLPAGALLDRYGRKRGLIAGLLLLGAALLWSGVAGSPTELIVSRGVAGVGGALVFPGTLATITSVLGPERRGTAVAMWAASVMAGGGYGLVLGGLMVELSAWGSALLVMAALAALCLIPTLLAVPETREPRDAHVDPIGALLSLVAVGALTVAVIELPVEGIGAPVVFGGFAIAAIAGAAFITWELRSSGPLLDVRLFADRMFGSASLAIFAMFAAAFGWFFLSFQYYSYVLGWGPLKCGLGLMPNIVPLVALAPFGSRLAERIGARNVMVLGLSVMAAGAALTAAAGSTRDFIWIAAGFALIGAGGGIGQGPATHAIVDALPRARQGVASAVNDVARELGAAVGIAVVGSAFNAGYRERIDELLGPAAGAVRDSPAVGLSVAPSMPSPATTIDAIESATVAGWHLGLATAAAVLAAAAVVVHLRLRRPSAREGLRMSYEYSDADATSGAMVSATSTSAERCSSGCPSSSAARVSR